MVSYTLAQADFRHGLGPDRTDIEARWCTVIDSRNMITYGADGFGEGG